MTTPAHGHGPYLTQSLHQSVQRTPDEVMTIFGDRMRTFREVADRVASFAGALHDLGIGPGDRVAILAGNSDDYCELMLATAWADAIFVPLNTRWSTAEVIYGVNDSGPRVLIVDQHFAGTVPELLENCPSLESVVCCGPGEIPANVHGYETLIAATAPVTDARRSGEETAGIFYTGGTTGFPKGVVLTHGNLQTAGLGAYAALTLGGGAYLHPAPMFHLGGIVPWVAHMIVGGSHVVLGEFGVRAVLEAIDAHEVRAMTLVPAMIQWIVNDPVAADFDLSSVRSILYGASPISESVLTRALEVFPSAGFAQGYGMSETTGPSSYLRADDHRAGRRLRSAGYSCPHAELKVVGDGDVELPAGTVGEVCVRGGGVMREYWNRPEETRKALRDGWMHTGDAGYLDDDGYLFIVDRLKDMIITGGENVYSTEVENAIDAHPAVAECAVIGRPDEQWGERVHAVVVVKQGLDLSADELRAHVSERIARYKAPRSVDFVPALPRTNTGKVLKRDLRDQYRP
ncbi:MAG: long-chain fatty acid--CoA ligase [Bacillota bacterium]|nr:long-chain fatty acid--CoA ligase [Bacillota bacterium]